MTRIGDPEWAAAGRRDTLSVVIPARNEAGNLTATVTQLVGALEAAGTAHEILVVDDGSIDGTVAELESLEKRLDTVRHVHNGPPHGFGLAVRKGLEEFRGDAVAIVMADGSDAPGDVVAFYQALREGYDCVFGSRFIAGGRTVDYPVHKLVLNRMANLFIKILFGFSYNDTTNAFKCYRREVVAGLHPLLSHHFNLTVEMPLKAIIRGYSYRVLPNSWHNRQHGVSKLRIREMGSRYLFIVLYCFFEKLLSRGDYRKPDTVSETQT